MRMAPVVIILLFSLFFTIPVLAEEQKPMASLNVSSLAKAAEFMKKYQSVINSPEGIAAMTRLAKALKNKQVEN